jgi:hypothetical protein
MQFDYCCPSPFDLLQIQPLPPSLHAGPRAAVFASTLLLPPLPSADHPESPLPPHAVQFWTLLAPRAPGVQWISSHEIDRSSDWTDLTEVLLVGFAWPAQPKSRSESTVNLVCAQWIVCVDAIFVCWVHVSAGSAGSLLGWPFKATCTIFFVCSILACGCTRICIFVLEMCLGPCTCYMFCMSSLMMSRICYWYC